MTKSIKNENKNENGQSMVELAVSIIVLLILLAGVVDLGRVAFYYIALQDAAQEAASYASIFPNNNEQIFVRAVDGIGGDGIDPSRIIVTLSIQKGKDGGTYSCLSSQTCSTDPDTTDSDISSKNIVSVGNLISVSIADSAFPITMPLLGTFIGSQTINLNTTIQDVVISVP